MTWARHLFGVLARMSDQLKPCPFCGSPAKESYGQTSNEHWVLCSNDSCDMQPVASSTDLDRVRKIWNTRDERDVAEMRAVLLGSSNLLRRCLRHGLLRAETEAMLLDIEAVLKEKGSP